LILVISAAGAHADPPAASPAALQQASFDRVPSRDQPQVVEFSRRRPRIGDEVGQTVALEVRLNTSLRQGNELIEQDQNMVRSGQRRIVTTTETAGVRTTAVEVRYLEANKQITAGNAAPTAPPATQPVQGKTYRCRRGPDADAKLIITDPQGQTPPQDEYEIVAQNMEMVGRPNPLVQFLAGRRVAVGETIELPEEIADQAFSFGKRFGQVTRFDLVLERVETRDGIECAVFLARIEAASNSSSQMRMQAEGPLVLQIDSCRAVRLALSGPIGISETRGSYSTVHQVIGAGQLRMSIDSAYRDAQR
jgi:hypothetical protein